MASLFHQRVAHFKLRKGGEIAIRRPQFACTVMETKGGNARVVNAGAFQPRRGGNVPQLLEVAGALGQQVQLRGREQGVHKAQRFRKGGRRFVDAGMCGDTNEFVDAGPRNGPGCRLMAQGINRFSIYGGSWRETSSVPKRISNSR